jgi:hypothetical protein
MQVRSLLKPLIAPIATPESGKLRDASIKAVTLSAPRFCELYRHDAEYHEEEGIWVIHNIDDSYSFSTKEEAERFLAKIQRIHRSKKQSPKAESE